MIPFIDSHAHLGDAAFDADRADVIRRARAEGAQAVVCIGESLAAAERARAIAAANPGFCAFTAGIHPHDAHQFDHNRDIPVIRALVNAGAVAVGECGLDYHYEHSPRDSQIAAFSAQLALADELSRPVVVHTREAEDDTRALVRQAGVDKIAGVLHCFTGTHALAEEGLLAGWYVSFSGIITFRKFADAALLRMIPGDRLLVESDSPYLAPMPYRGKRNEPAWVSRTVARLAEVRGEDPEALGRQTAANARTLFSLT